jgi:hopanoid-associated phosphorylase
MAKRATAPIVAVTGMAFEARIARGPEIETVFAARADLLERALRRALARGASGVISFGTAGGLDADLTPGTLILADAIESGGNPETGRIATDPDWTARMAAALAASPIASRVRRGTLAAVAAPVATVDQKAALHRSSGALAVDMESRIAATAARESGVPFVACRAIVDPAWRALPRAATAGLRDDGTTALLPILAELVKAPLQLNAMIRLAADARAARASLVEARRALGSAFARGSMSEQPTE